MKNLCFLLLVLSVLLIANRNYTYLRIKYEYRFGMLLFQMELLLMHKKNWSRIIFPSFSSIDCLFTGLIFSLVSLHSFWFIFDFKLINFLTLATYVYIYITVHCPLISAYEHKISVCLPLFLLPYPIWNYSIYNRINTFNTILIFLCNLIRINISLSLWLSSN